MGFQACTFAKILRNSKQFFKINAYKKFIDKKIMEILPNAKERTESYVKTNTVEGIIYSIYSQKGKKV